MQGGANYTISLGYSARAPEPIDRHTEDMTKLRSALLAAVRATAMAFLSIFSLALFILAVLSIAFIVLGVGVFITPIVITMMRRHADFRRRLAREWFGVEIRRPYRPEPELHSGVTGALQRCEWMLKDPATWRDLLWTLTDSTACFVLAVLAGGFFVEGLYGFVLAAGVWRPVANAGGDWYTFDHITNATAGHEAALLGVVLIGLGCMFSAPIMRVHTRLGAALLAPTPARALALRVAHLTESRSDALDTQAAELRRIERDLHDGAQARLVAVGMSLGAVEHLIEQDPEKARQLLAEARRSSAQALGELRDLVRGIHPPVLAERGLGDAVRALAMASPLIVEVTTDLPDRLDPPVESAAYFAVSEMLTNAAKHSGAQRAWIDLRHEGDPGTLRFTVSDDGHGGADAARGTGLTGIERRLAAFDGVLSVSSPEGGPTVVAMELVYVADSLRC